MHSISMMPKVKERFERSFQPTVPNTKNSKPCRIKVDGKFVRTHAGKSVWAAKGHAKLALRNALGYSFERILCEEMDLPLDTSYGHSRQTRNRAYKEFLDTAQKEGYIEFVEVDE